MTRIFSTRFACPANWVVLLVPGLLVGLACATPFPTENLEEGMAAETVRESFGGPEAIENEPEGAESSWTYFHEELEPVPLTVGPMPVRVAVASIWGVPFSWFFALAGLAGDNYYWNMMYVSRAPVVLQFEEEKLFRWEVLPDVRSTSNGGGGYHDPFPSTMTFPTKDSRHHQKGHGHHHDH